MYQQVKHDTPLILVNTVSNTSYTDIRQNVNPLM